MNQAAPEPAAADAARSRSTDSLARLRVTGTGVLAEGVLKRNDSIVAAWRHLEEGLLTLASRNDGRYAAMNENGLTKLLVEEIEGTAQYRPYWFDREDMEDPEDGHSPRVDVAVKAREGGVVINGILWDKGRRFMAIEAKRLPADRASREREYLTGAKGGVERFKLGTHASELRDVGIIGYVQRHDFDYWVIQINGWVDELSQSSRPELPWDSQDRLQVETMTHKVATLRSESLRVLDRRRLGIRHLWVRLSGPTTATGGTHEGGRRTRQRRGTE